MWDPFYFFKNLIYIIKHIVTNKNKVILWTNKSNNQLVEV